MVKIDFEFDSDYGVYRDAIVLPDDHGFSEAEIEAMKQQRFENWIAVITVVSEEPEEVIEAPQGEE